MILVDVFSQFTKILLNYATDVTSKQIFGDKEIGTQISRKKMKILILLCTKNVHLTLIALCTKNVHLTFENNKNHKKDGNAMGSPVGTILAENFMMHLKRKLMPKLENLMKP